MTTRQAGDSPRKSEKFGGGGLAGLVAVSVSVLSLLYAFIIMPLRERVLELEREIKNISEREERQNHLIMKGFSEIGFRIGKLESIKQNEQQR